MFEIRVEDHFAAAHYLAHYHGKCERLHGHNYRVRAWVRGEELSAGGMLLDFSILKKNLAAILETLDHRHLNELDFFASGEPSAERIAHYIGQEFQRCHPEIPIYRIDVFETEKNMASWVF